MKRVIKKALDSLSLFAFARDIYKRCKYLINFSLQSRNARFRDQGAPDGLPIPPPHLVDLVVDHYDLEKFYRSGVIGSKYIKSILEKNGLDINECKSILDFGCGCGRIMRNWKTLKGPRLYGTDYNSVLVHWCQRALSFAEFKTNKSPYRLDYEDNKFDFIYAISVFTHLTEKLQNFWINELKRILKPGGFLLMTVWGTAREHELRPEERERFKLGQLVIQYEKYAGANICNAIYPEKYVRQHLAKGFAIVDFIAAGAKDYNQDGSCQPLPTIASSGYFIPGGPKDYAQDMFLLRKPTKDD